MPANLTQLRIARVLVLLTLLLLGPLEGPGVVGAQAIPEKATIEGRVHTLDGQPMGGTQVQARMDGRIVARTATSADGLYRLSVPAGTVQLEAHRLDWLSEGEHPVTVLPGETRRVDLPLRLDPPRAQGLVATVNGGSRSPETLPLSHAAALDPDEVGRRATASLADVVAPEAGVHVQETSLDGRTINTRGFSNVFTGAVLFLVDYRDAAIPSLRADFTHFIPTSIQDVERVEVVLGPTTAIYGPNAANGVVHVITPSPLAPPRTGVSLAAGNQSIFRGHFTTSSPLGRRFGLRVSGAWTRGEDFAHVDPVEAAILQEIETDPGGYAQKLRDRGVPEEEIPIRMSRAGIRDLDMERRRLEGRLDALLPTGDTLVLQAGTSENAGLELTPLGAAQAGGWRYGYLQTRLHGGPLFAQLYLNTSSAGETFLLRDGAALVDESRVVGAQIRHGTELSGGRHEVTYGADWTLTTPRTGGTIHGQFEDDDEVEEYGGYVQGRLGLTDRLDLIGTGRLDWSNTLENAVFSPRMGLTFEENETRSFRLSLARGFATPTPTNRFLDLSGGRAPDDLGRLGYFTRARGTGREGIRFGQAQGALVMRSPFTPGDAGGPSALLPATTRNLWLNGVELLVQNGLDSQTAAYLRSLDPGDAVLVRALNPVTGSLTPLGQTNIPDIQPLEETTTTTLEAGFQDLIGDRVLVQGSLWHTWRKNFTSPLYVRTPLLLLDGTDLAGFLESNGLPAEEAGGIAQILGSAPLGVVSSEDVQGQGAELVASYINYGDLTYWGAELGATIPLDRRWRIDGSLSWVSRDHFTVDGERVALNAPELKGSVGVGFTNLGVPLDGEVRMRFHSGFPVSSGDYVGTRCLGDGGPLVEDCVDSAALVDLTLAHPLPVRGTSLRLQARNLFDTPYRSFVGSPTTGRLLSLRMDWAIR